MDVHKLIVIIEKIIEKKNFEKERKNLHKFAAKTWRNFLEKTRLLLSEKG